MRGRGTCPTLRPKRPKLLTRENVIPHPSLGRIHPSHRPRPKPLTCKGTAGRLGRQCGPMAVNRDHVPVHVTVGDGPGEWVVYGCDLSREYISINADYTT